MRTKQTETSWMTQAQAWKGDSCNPRQKVDDVDMAETQCRQTREAKDTQHMKDVWGALAEAHDSAFNGHCQVRISESSSHEP